MLDTITDWPDSISDPDEVAAALVVLWSYARDRPQLPDRRQEVQLARLVGDPPLRTRRGDMFAWSPPFSPETGAPAWPLGSLPPVLAVLDFASFYELDRSGAHVACESPAGDQSGVPVTRTAGTGTPRMQVTVADPGTVPPSPAGTHALLRAGNTAAAIGAETSSYADRENARNAPGWRQEARAAQDLTDTAYALLGASTASWLPTVRQLVRVDVSVRAEKTPPPPRVPVNLRVQVP